MMVNTEVDLSGKPVGKELFRCQIHGDDVLRYKSGLLQIGAYIWQILFGNLLIAVEKSRLPRTAQSMAQRRRRAERIPVRILVRQEQKSVLLLQKPRSLQNITAVHLRRHHAGCSGSPAVR